MSKDEQLTIEETYKQDKLVITYEVFPPKTEDDILKLVDELKKLKKFSPQFVSVTYGAGGSTQDRSTKLLEVIMNSCEMNVVPHFTCIGSSRESILNFLQLLKDLQIKNILALRGDSPQNNPNYVPQSDSFKYANELVEFIKANSALSIAVAGYPDVHPEAESPEKDLDNLKRKVDAGASAVITQLFYDNNSFFRFVEKSKKAKINVPIIPGILPLSNYSQIDRIVAMCGACVPVKLKNTLIKYKDDNDSFKKTGVENAIYQIKELINFGIKGIHMYTLNKSEVTSRVLKNIVS